MGAQVAFKSGLRRVWREPGVVQIGVSARRGTVLDGIAPADGRLLERLRTGVDPDRPDIRGSQPAVVARARELLRLLSDADVLIRRRTSADDLSGLDAHLGRLAPDAAVWSVVQPGAGDGWQVIAARRACRVVVEGAGRTGTALAAALAAAGIGRVHVTDPRPVTVGDLAPGGPGPDDLGRARAEFAAEQVARFGAATGPPDPDPPDLVVLVHHAAADASRADPLLSADVPHLSVVVREDDVVVGPLVLPGRGPCLRCLDLHRTDRDRAWPAVLTQLTRPPSGTPEPEETAVSAMAAGLAALQVLTQVDGTHVPATVGATLEIELPNGLVGRRPWPAHPRCGCHWPAGGRMGT